MIIFEFIYTECIFESAFVTMSIHKTKCGAYKAMRDYLEKEYLAWYNHRIWYGKDKDRLDKYGIFCAWKVRPRLLND